MLEPVGSPAVIGRLTVYFEDPFWVGIFECIEDEKLSVCKVTFGVEPKDYEHLGYRTHRHDSLKCENGVVLVYDVMTKKIK